jgi:hypothetical protein
MTKYSFAKASLSVITLVSGLIFHAQFPSRVWAQAPLETAIAKGPSSSIDAVLPTTSNDVFLQLAATVGQTASAKKLIEYKLKNDAASQQRYYAVVDFDQPSTSKRLYVFDTFEKKVHAYYVAHGRGSEGAAGTNIPAKFSNLSGSNRSSLGIYRTAGEYIGQHGRSLRLEGLESTNSNALARAVVMHTADYVSDAFIHQTGRLGRSQGCFAVERSVGDTLINELKNGAYIIAAKD